MTTLADREVRCLKCGSLFGLREGSLFQSKTAHHYAYTGGVLSMVCGRCQTPRLLNLDRPFAEVCYSRV